MLLLVVVVVLWRRTSRLSIIPFFIFCKVAMFLLRILMGTWLCEQFVLHGNAEGKRREEWERWSTTCGKEEIPPSLAKRHLLSSQLYVLNCSPNCPLIFLFVQVLIKQPF